MKRERKEHSMSFEEFSNYEKKKITEGKLSPPVKLMYSESLSLSERWRQRFIDFWDLPNDFQMEEGD
jgi:N-methylhydantoinase B/acetone carboxylase alpha subunit